MHHVLHKISLENKESLLCILFSSVACDPSIRVKSNSELQKAVSPLYRRSCQISVLCTSYNLFVERAELTAIVSPMDTMLCAVCPAYNLYGESDKKLCFVVAKRGGVDEIGEGD